MSNKVRLDMRMGQNLVKLVDEIAKKLGEDRTDFTRSAWLLRIQTLTESGILTFIDKISSETGEKTIEAVVEGA